MAGSGAGARVDAEVQLQLHLVQLAPISRHGERGDLTGNPAGVAPGRRASGFAPPSISWRITKCSARSSISLAL